MRALATLLVVAALVAGLWYATLRAASVECEACMTYEGRAACRSARAATRAEAERTAIATACATLTQGVTGTLACERAVPVSLGCTPP